jgi:tetratricopeptide (TPR) repeat protein
MWGGVESLEQAVQLADDPDYWLSLAGLYLELDLRMLALRAFRRALKGDPSLRQVVGVMVNALEYDVQALAHQLDRPIAKVEKGLYYLDKGQQGLQTGDFTACVTANQRAIKFLPGWPPPQNNLSLGLFFEGRPEEAIATARQVLSKNPQNVQALSNAIRFLTWTGHEEEARTLWPRVAEATPRDDLRPKMAEAAAILQKDEFVYQVLKPLEKAGTVEGKTPEIGPIVQLFLGVAEANLGRRKSAQRRLKTVQGQIPWVESLLAALKAKKPGPGLADRFPYFHSSDLMRRDSILAFGQLLDRQEELSPKKFRAQMDHYVARFPQIVRFAEKLIWEEDQIKPGIEILATVGTPAAHAALRRFGLSQAGKTEDRLQALTSLSEADQIGPDEEIRIWDKGQWQEVQLRRYEISDEPKSTYRPKVANLLEQAVLAFKQDQKDEQAERLFQQVLKINPQVKEAYNNLGAIYSHRGELERAKEMYRTALEIDPTYVFPRCNLALFLLQDDKLEEAKEMVKPLAMKTRFHPQEMAFFSFLQARIAIEEDDYDTARNALEAALEVEPDYQPAKDLLDRLDNTPFGFLSGHFKAFMEKQRQRDRSRRETLQTKLKTAEPSLSELLPLYTKDSLTGMAREVIPWGGWSGLRKAELVEELIKALTDHSTLQQVVDRLSDEEQAALKEVLGEGGSMAWQRFDEQYDNDLDESRHWQWHTPETTMGRLRLLGLLAEATVDDELLVVVPADLRSSLLEILE